MSRLRSRQQLQATGHQPRDVEEEVGGESGEFLRRGRGDGWHRPIQTVVGSVALALLILALSSLSGSPPSSASAPSTRGLSQSWGGGNAATVVVDDDNGDKLVSDLLSWLRRNGAFIDERLDVRHMDPNDPTSPRGLFATGTFNKGERLFSIPWHLIIGGRAKDDCETVWAVRDAMLTGDTPYGRYLASQPRRYLPGYWSKEGNGFLTRMLGSKLPRTKIVDEIRKDWLDDCDGATTDELEIHANMLVTARADSELMTPLYDMINHRNGRWYNAEHSGVHGKHFDLVTNRRVEAGEEFYCSYTQCTPSVCDSPWRYYAGTPDIFATYGFVEPVPQRYFFENVRLKFDLDEKEGGAPGELEVKFFVPPSERGVAFLRSELKRLQKFAEGKNTEETREALGVPEKEWDATWQYHNALVVALTHALKKAKASKVSEEVWDMGRHWYKEGHR